MDRFDPETQETTGKVWIPDHLEEPETRTKLVPMWVIATGLVLAASLVGAGIFYALPEAKPETKTIADTLSPSPSSQVHATSENVARALSFGVAQRMAGGLSNEEIASYVHRMGELTQCQGSVYWWLVPKKQRLRKNLITRINSHVRRLNRDKAFDAYHQQAVPIRPTKVDGVKVIAIYVLAGAQCP